MCPAAFSKRRKNLFHTLAFFTPYSCEQRCKIRLISKTLLCSIQEQFDEVGQEHASPLSAFGCGRAEAEYTYRDSMRERATS